MSARESMPWEVRSSRRRCDLRLVLSWAVAAWLLGTCICGAAAPAKPESKPAKPESKKEKLPESKDTVLLTNDGLKLATTYYPGTKGKDSVPVVLLHAQKGSRKDYAELAVDLQRLGHAVLVPDLRGHGESTELRGRRSALSAVDLSRADYLRMVTGDMEAVKDFLREENNKGNLNIEKLCVVGAEMGASVALTWTQFDWSHPPVGVFKLGQDVKALVLISPEWSTPGLPLKPVLTTSNARFPLTDPLLISAAKKGAITLKNAYELDLRREVSVMIVAGGGDSRAVRDAQRLYSMLKRYHPDPPEKEAEKKQDLYYGTLETSLQGTKMLGVSGLGLEEFIGTFIQRRLVDQGFPWQQRTRDPHAQKK